MPEYVIKGRFVFYKAGTEIGINNTLIAMEMMPIIQNAFPE